MSEQDKKPEVPRPAWLDDDAAAPPNNWDLPVPQEAPSWAELPRLEVGDQASASMSFRFPVVPAVPMPAPTSDPPGLLPPPPGMVVVNDDFAGLRRLSAPKPAEEPKPAEPSPTDAPASSNTIGENGDPTQTMALRGTGRSRPVIELAAPPAPAPPGPAAPPRIADPPSGPESPARTVRADELRRLRGDPAPEPPAAAPRGQPIVYGIVVRNTSTDPMFQVRIEHQLPPGPRYLGADPPPQILGRKLVWELGTLEPGTKQRFKITIQPNRPDEVPEDATALFQVFQCLQSRTRVLRPAVSAALRLPDEAVVGRRVPLVVEAANSGLAGATDVRVFVVLAAGLSHPDGPVLQFAQPRLGPGSRLRFETELLVERAGDYTVPAHIVGNGKVLAGTQATLRAVGADLHVRVEGPPTCPVGYEFACQIDASNLGQLSAESVNLALTLPDGLDAADSGGAEVDLESRRLTWPLGSLPPGETRRRGLRLTAQRPGTFALRVEARDNHGHEAAATKSVTFEGTLKDPLSRSHAGTGKTARGLATLPAPGDTTAAAAVEGETAGQPFVLFMLSDSCYAVPVGRVREVSRLLAPTPIPGAPDWLPGVVDVRGESMPLVDLRRRLNMPTGDGSSRLLLVHGEATGAAAILVDRTIGVRQLRPSAAVLGQDLALASAEHDGRQVIVLDLDQLLQAPELQSLNPATA